MEQRFIQTQEQKLQQVQRLSQQQMLQVHLLEMPLTELEENVNAELDDNPALEVSSTEDALDNPHDRDTDDRIATIMAPQTARRKDATAMTTMVRTSSVTNSTDRTSVKNASRR